MSDLFFWQNMPSIHQAPLLRSVAAQWCGDVTVVTEWPIDPKRSALGWNCPDYGAARLLVAPSCAERAAIAASRQAETGVHVFSGIRSYPKTFETFRRICKGRALVGCYVERGWTGDGLKSFLRPWLYRWYAARWGARIDFMLATGRQAVCFYRRSGFSAGKLASFGYFVDSTQEGDRSGLLPSAPDVGEPLVRICYVGELAEWKGVDLLLMALAEVVDVRWRLSIVGSGKQSGRLRTLVRLLALDDRIDWLGVLSNVAVRNHLAATDLLVLPSRYDGWGAVVNEALMAGAMVVASDSCGSEVLVGDDWRGGVFQSGSVPALKACLEQILPRLPLDADRRDRIRQWAAHAISPAAAAAHLIAVIEAARSKRAFPRPPWEREMDRA